MIKSLDEAISYYKIKYNLLKNYDPLRAKEYKQLADWLIDLKRLKEKEEAEDTFHNILCDVLGINEDECLSDEALSDILNNNEWSEKTKKEVETILQKREEKQLKKYDNYTKSQVDENINEKEIEALKEGLCQ